MWRGTGGSLLLAWRSGGTGRRWRPSPARCTSWAGRRAGTATTAPSSPTTPPQARTSKFAVENAKAVFLIHFIDSGSQALVLHDQTF